MLVGEWVKMRCVLCMLMDSAPTVEEIRVKVGGASVSFLIKSRILCECAQTRFLSLSCYVMDNYAMDDFFYLSRNLFSDETKTLKKNAADVVCTDMRLQMP